MKYISHEDYKKMLTSFGKEVPKTKLNEDFERPDARETEEENELGRITDAVDRVFANDSLTTEKEVDALAEDIRNAWSRARGYGQGDEIDFVAEYLTDWAHNVRHDQFSQWEKPSVGQEENTIWGEDWKNWINTSVRDISEGNAFTAGLAKTKKGGEFKVGNKSFKDRTNYDASVGEDYHPDDPAGQDSAAARGEDDYEGVEEGDAEILGHVKGDIYKVKTPKGEVIDLEFELEKGDQVDDYGWEGTLYASDDDYEYILPVALVPMGGGDWDVTPYYKEFNAHPFKKKVDEYQFDQMYPDDPGPFEGIEKKLKEFLAKEDDVNWEAMDDKEAEENQTDNGMEEDINLPSSQPTGPSIEEKRSRLAHLTSEERDQLKQYVETIKTVKEEIKKMVGKKDMEEGGDNTNLVMQPTTVSEDGGGEHEEIESNLDPKIHDAFHKVAGMAVKSLIKAGIEPDQIKAFFQHEISELPDFVTNQYEE